MLRRGALGLGAAAALLIDAPELFEEPRVPGLLEVALEPVQLLFDRGGPRTAVAGSFRQVSTHLAGSIGAPTCTRTSERNT